ncbi:MAG: hypothetical protein M3Y87_04800 [Myxococcota bacterium]|nr:hypothetical protein [Myxococcota bacterium]
MSMSMYAARGGRADRRRSRLPLALGESVSKDRLVGAATALISLADRRARRLVDRLLGIQGDIDQSARLLLAGRPCEAKLEDLLDGMDRCLCDLARTAQHVDAPRLRDAIDVTCRAHARWSRARLGSDEERSAAAVYLESVDALAKVASDRRR